MGADLAAGRGSIRMEDIAIAPSAARTAMSFLAAGATEAECAAGDCRISQQRDDILQPSATAIEVSWH